MKICTHIHRSLDKCGGQVAGQVWCSMFTGNDDNNPVLPPFKSDTYKRKVKNVTHFTDHCACGLPNSKFCMLHLNAARVARIKEVKKYAWAPLEIYGGNKGSSSTSSVPISTADLLYGNDVKSVHSEGFRQNGYLDVDRDRTRARELIEQANRPSNKVVTRKSHSGEKVFTEREKEDLRNLVPSIQLKNNNNRPAGFRNNVVKGDSMLSSRSNAAVSSSCKEPEDSLVAMGTIWSPTFQKGQNSLNTNSSVRTVSIGSVSQSNSSSRKNSFRPIVVQQNSHSNIRSTRDNEPKYSDPQVGATASFHQRLSELSSLEAETIRWERTRKIKKKAKQDRDS